MPIFRAGLRFVAVSVLLCANAGVWAQAAVSPALPAGHHQATMIERYGKPYVLVTINGHGPYRFVIDTGTGAEALVTPQLAEELGLPTVGQASLSDPSGQGSRKAPMVRIDTLEFAGVTFRGVKAVSHGFFAEAGSCQGLLGFTLFRDYLLTLDFPDRRVLLEEGSLAPDGEKNVLPFRIREGVPVAMLQINGLDPTEAQLDSGGGGLVLPEAMVPLLRFDVAPVLYASGQSVATKFQLKAAQLRGDVRLGRYTFPHPFVQIHPAFPLINFGSPPMQKFSITFDQHNLLVRFWARDKRLRLTAPATPPHITNQPRPQQPDPTLVPVG